MEKFGGLQIRALENGAAAESFCSRNTAACSRDLANTTSCTRCCMLARLGEYYLSHQMLHARETWGTLSLAPDAACSQDLGNTVSWRSKNTEAERDHLPRVRVRPCSCPRVVSLCSPLCPAFYFVTTLLFMATRT